MPVLFWLCLTALLFVAIGALDHMLGPDGDGLDRFFFTVSAGGLVLLFLNVDYFFQGTQQCFPTT